MKYKIFEKILNETVGAPDSRFLCEVEAESFDAACKVARQQHPQVWTLKVEDTTNATVEFEVVDGK